MKSCGRVRESESKTPERKGWVLLMHDSPPYNGLGECSIDSFFFEMPYKQFLDEIKDDVDSFFGYPDGCPDGHADAIDAYDSMWKQLATKREFGEHGRRVELVRGTAIMRDRTKLVRQHQAT